MLLTLLFIANIIFAIVPPYDFHNVINAFAAGFVGYALMEKIYDKWEERQSS